LLHLLLSCFCFSSLCAHRDLTSCPTRRSSDLEGAKLFGGRWNSRGRACVYLSRYESLAILEVLVHLENTAVLKEFTLFQVSIKADRKSTRLNSSHVKISYAVFCLKKKKIQIIL